MLSKVSPDLGLHFVRGTLVYKCILAMGFDYKRKYDQPEDLTRLRYGKLMIMTDQDVDGSHIKGLVVNFLHHFWPNMIRTPIIQEFITPIVKVTPKRNKKDVRNFYSLPEFQKWQDEVPNPQAYDVKYYKVLFFFAKLWFLTFKNRVWVLQLL